MSVRLIRECVRSNHAGYLPLLWVNVFPLLYSFSRPFYSTEDVRPLSLFSAGQVEHLELFDQDRNDSRSHLVRYVICFCLLGDLFYYHHCVHISYISCGKWARNIDGSQTNFAIALIKCFPIVLFIVSTIPFN